MLGRTHIEENHRIVGAFQKSILDILVINIMRDKGQWVDAMEDLMQPNTNTNRPCFGPLLANSKPDSALLTMHFFCL
jgi:hypothetical protein